MTIEAQLVIKSAAHLIVGCRRCKYFLDKYRRRASSCLSKLFWKSLTSLVNGALDEYLTKIMIADFFFFVIRRNCSRAAIITDYYNIKAFHTNKLKLLNAPFVRNMCECAVWNMNVGLYGVWNINGIRLNECCTCFHYSAFWSDFYSSWNSEHRSMRVMCNPKRSYRTLSVDVQWNYSNFPCSVRLS